MHLPRWLSDTVFDPIESVPPIHAEGSERCDDRTAESGTTEQPGGIEIPGPLPEVACVVKRVEIQLLADA